MAKSKCLNEITICGMHIGLKSGVLLNQGLLSCQTLRKLKLNFCFANKEVLETLLPALT